MQYLGSVKKLYISKINQREKVDTITCDEFGILDDKFYNKDKNRSILLSSLQSYELAKQNNINLDYGLLGENILLDFDPHKLSIGSVISIGEVKLQISQECTLCKHLNTIDNKLATLLKNDRGIFAYALNDGEIKLNDKVYIN